MKKILLFSVLLLAGCQLCPTQPEPSVVVKTEYIVRQAPDDMYALPPQVTTLDVNNATQKDIAIWITDSESRTNTLETMIKALQIYFNAPVKDMEKPVVNK